MTEEELFQKIEEWAGGPLSAKAWWKEHRIPSLGHKTCEELVKEGKLEAIKDYIVRVEYGVYQ